MCDHGDDKTSLYYHVFPVMTCLILRHIIFNLGRKAGKVQLACRHTPLLPTPLVH